MYLIPFVFSVAHLPVGKTIYTIRVLQEGDHVWQETDVALALEENGLVPLSSFSSSSAPIRLEEHDCLFVRIDPKRTDLSLMYSEEELDPADKETHRWCTYRIVQNTGDKTIWLPPPPDAILHPFSLGGVLRHILKACDVELVNGGWTA
jgi:hypothetical protein